MNTTGVCIIGDERRLWTGSLDSQEFLGELYKRYYPKVYHSCLSYAKSQDDAFDFAHDVMLKAFSHIGAFEGKSTFSTWLFSITRNHCISQVTKHKKFQFVDIDPAHHLIAQEPDHEELENRKKNERLEADLQRYLDLLPVGDRQMLELKYFHNYSIKDLQRAYNLSASAVKMRLLRARQRIEQILEVQSAA